MPKTDITLKINQTRQYSGGLGGGVPVSVAAGGPSAANADTVDGYHASVYPIAGYLLALDGSALIPDAAIPATVVRTTRQVIAGNGLTGGGDLSADRTLAVQLIANSGLSLTASGLGLDTPGAISVSSVATVGPNHSHPVTASAAPGAAAALVKTAADGSVTLAALTANSLTATSASLAYQAFKTITMQAASVAQIILLAYSGQANVKINGRFVGYRSSGSTSNIVEIECQVSSGSGGTIDGAINVRGRLYRVTVAPITCTYGGQTWYGIRLYGATASYYPDTMVWVGRDSTSGFTVVDETTVTDIANWSPSSVTYASKFYPINFYKTTTFYAAPMPGANNTYNLGASGTRWKTVYGVVGDFSTQVVTPDITNAGNLTIDPAGDVIFNPTNNGLLPAVGYDLNIGSLAKKYLTLHAAELWVETLVAQNTIATIGGRILVGPTTTLTRDLAAAATTIYVKHNEMAFGDRVYMEASGKVEFMAITSGPTLQAEGDYAYTVTRDLDGSGANDWYAGDAVFNTGIAGEGFIDIYSVRGVKNAFQYGPAIVGNVRMSNTYNDWEEHWAIGQLNGVYGYSTNVYGVALGRYSPTAKSAYLTMDATSGLQIWSRDGGTSVLLAKWDIDGNVIIGRDAAGQSNVYITSTGVYLRNNTTNLITLDGAAATVLVGQQAAGQSNVLISSGALQLRNNTTVMIQLAANGMATFEGFVSLGTNGGIYQGTGTAGSPTTGLKIWRDSGIGRIAGYNSGTLQWYAGTDGKLYAVAGKFVADAEAVKLSSDGDGDTPEIQFLGDFSTKFGALWGNWNSLIGSTYLYLVGYANDGATVDVGAERTASGERAKIRFIASSTPTYRIDFIVGTAASDIPLSITKTGLLYYADLHPYRNSTTYTAYPYVPLATPLTSTSFDGDAFSSCGYTKIDTSVVFGAPAGIKVAWVRLIARDSAASPQTGLYVSLSTKGTDATVQAGVYPHGDDQFATGVFPVACDANGDFYYKVSASGSGTTDIWMTIVGYSI